MIIYDDPIDFELSRRRLETSTDAPTEPLTGVLTDVQGSPSETFRLDHFGRVMAAREQLRRSAE